MTMNLSDPRINVGLVHRLVLIVLFPLLIVDFRAVFFSIETKNRLRNLTINKMK
jgi:hypothetical protein